MQNLRLDLAPAVTGAQAVPDEGGLMSRFVVMADWSDAPHLSPEVQAELLASIPPYQRDARSKGIPALGAGAIYPVPESDIVVDPFPIPDHWIRGYGLDVGWNRTAAAFGAKDRQTGITYIYSEHYRGEAEPSTHVAAIRERCRRPGQTGEPKIWIPGRIDPAARGRSQVDGIQLLQSYQDLGLELGIALNAVESGIYTVWMALAEGRLKVFRTCQNWIAEFRLYHRDEKGRVVKERDHLMDATRYLLASGDDWLVPVPPVNGAAEEIPGSRGSGGRSSSWMEC